MVVQGRSQEPLVVVLTENQKERIGTQLAPGVTEGHTRSPSPFDPDVATGPARTQVDRKFGQPEVGVDLERASLHAERFGADGRTGVTVDDDRAHAEPRELIREHQAGRTGTDDEDVCLGWNRGGHAYL